MENKMNVSVEADPVNTEILEKDLKGASKDGAVDAVLRRMEPYNILNSALWAIRWVGEPHSQVPIGLRETWTGESICQKAIDNWSNTLGKLPDYQRSKDRQKANARLGS